MKSSNRKIVGCRFHHVAMKVVDFDAVVRFYTEGLGFSVAMQWGEGDGRAVMLDCGDGRCIEVFAGGKASVDEGNLLHFCLGVPDVDAAFRRALAAGAKPTMDPARVEVPGGPSPMSVYIAFCRGLAGETIEFFRVT